MHVMIGPVPPSEPPYEQESCCAGVCCGGLCLEEPGIARVEVRRLAAAPQVGVHPAATGSAVAGGSAPGRRPVGPQPARPDPDTTRTPTAGRAGTRPSGPAGTRPGRTTIRGPEGWATRAAGVFLRLYLEALTGHRPAQALRAVCSPDAHRQLVLDIDQQRGTPGTARVSSLRVSSPAPSVIEAVVMLHRSSRIWAMTLRLERPADTWLCTHLQSLRPGGPAKPDTH
ncbi:Rv3235 family protein [Longispora urticae]